MLHRCMPPPPVVNNPGLVPQTQELWTKYLLVLPGDMEDGVVVSKHTHTEALNSNWEFVQLSYT